MPVALFLSPPSGPFSNNPMQNGGKRANELFSCDRKGRQGTEKGEGQLASELSEKVQEASCGTGRDVGG